MIEKTRYNHLKLINIFLILLFFISFPFLAKLVNAAPKPIENQISDYINTQQQEQLLLLEKLVNINSGTTNLVGVRKIGEILRPKFEELGFTVRWAEAPVDMGRVGTLIAERSGGKSKKLLLIGHLDTVFPSNSPFQSFKKINHFATGPGVIDDKGGDVVILYALKALHDINALKESNITVVLTGDEEDSGKPTFISRKPLIDVAKKSDIALDFEWAITPDTATIARRGISHWTLTTEGKEAHSSEIFQEKAGYGALYELTRILDATRIQLADEKYLSFNPGLILGGTTINYDKANSQGTVFGKANVIAKIAIAKGDLRFFTEQQKINAQEKISAIVRSHLPRTTASITFQDGIPAMPPDSANLELLKKYSQASIKLGYGAVEQFDPGRRGAGDISHIASLVSASLAGLGPVGTGAHSHEETLDIHSLTMQTKRASLLIYELIHEK